MRLRVLAGSLLLPVELATFSIALYFGALLLGDHEASTNSTKHTICALYIATCAIFAITAISCTIYAIKAEDFEDCTTLAPFIAVVLAGLQFAPFADLVIGMWWNGYL